MNDRRSITVHLSKKGLAKIQIETNTKVEAADANLKATVLDKIPLADESNKALTVLPAANQKALKVLQIAAGEKLKDKIKQAKISFVMSKEELGSSKASDIVLLRFADGKWNQLETTAGSAKADGSVEFTATTPGFSVFVVTTKPSSTAPVTTAIQPPSGQKTDDSGEKTTPGTQDSAQKTGDTGQKTAPAGEGDIPLIGIIAAVVVIGGIGGAVLMKKKK